MYWYNQITSRISMTKIYGSQFIQNPKSVTIDLVNITLGRLPIGQRIRESGGK